ADEDLGDITCLGTAAGDNPTLVALDEGERRAFKIGPSLQYDARDNPFFPTTGFLISASLDYSVGRSRAQPEDDFSPQSFLRGEAAFTTYFAFGPTVLAVSARGGHINSLENEVPIFERFFLGGRTTLRGFQERALIAEDCQIVSDENVPDASDQCIIGVSAGSVPITQGGQTYALLKAEFRVPISGAASLGFFVDSGNLWFSLPNEIDELRVRYSTGAGLRYNTPVGPLALDVGVNPSRREENGEDWTALHFTVGVF
ncbi:MAG: BamA/TamA family outer membrane protein, partial [Myxococcota bacterium]